MVHAKEYVMEYDDKMGYGDLICDEIRLILPRIPGGLGNRRGKSISKYIFAVP